MKFTVSTMITKVLKRVTVVIVAFLASGPVSGVIAQAGVTIDPNIAGLFVFGLLESIRNILKNKFGVKFL